MRENILRIKENMKKVIIGKDEVMDRILTALLSGGHVLLEDLPGTGKTVLAKSLAKSMNGEFRRVQFTPDLLPSDVTGLHYFNQKEGEFQFREGPVFTQILLADEINRATPRTQSSLLECMEERQVTIDGETRKLDEVFFVIATQNPIESSGTFPLPEAQMDRFFMKLKLGYMTREEELSVICRPSTGKIVDELECVVSLEEIAKLKEMIPQITVSDDVAGYMMDIVTQTRKESHFALGVSTRGAIALYKASQVTAAFAGRDYVIPEDVRYIAPFVLGHRVTVNGTVRPGEIEKYFQEMLASIPSPLEAIRR